MKKKQERKYFFGKKIKLARIEKNMTLQKLAKELNITHVTLIGYENNSISISAEQLYKIAQILDKPISYFFSEELTEKNIKDAIKDKEKREIIDIVLKLTNGEKKIAKNFLTALKDGKVSGIENNEDLLKDIMNTLKFTKENEYLIRKALVMLGNLDKEKLESLLKLIK